MAANGENRWPPAGRNRWPLTVCPAQAVCEFRRSCIGSIASRAGGATARSPAKGRFPWPPSPLLTDLGQMLNPPDSARMHKSPRGIHVGVAARQHDQPSPVAYVCCFTSSRCGAKAAVVAARSNVSDWIATVTASVKCVAAARAISTR